MPKIKRTLTRDRSNRSRAVAELELRLAPDGQARCEDGLSPGFSVTGEIYMARSNASGAARQRMGRESDYSGAIGDELARIMPEIAPIAALHLSDPDGAPTHAEANGWYWYSSYDGQGTHPIGDSRSDYEVACDYLRMDAIPGPQNRASFTALVDTQRERWAAEAARAREILEALPTEED
jgi:hypothetical protein